MADYILCSTALTGEIYVHAAGIASVLAAHKPSVKVVGCQPENSCIMANSVEAGNIVNSQSSPTLSEGTAGTNVITGAGSFSGYNVRSVQIYTEPVF